MIPYIGIKSQREINDYFEYGKIGLAGGPQKIIEPFANFPLFTLVCLMQAYKGEVDLYFLDEDNENLLRNIIDRPEKMAKAYEKLWQAQLNSKEEDYYKKLEVKYEKSKDKELRASYLSYLIERKGKRLGKKPSKIQDYYLKISYSLKGRVNIRSGPYMQEEGKDSDLYFIPFIGEKKEEIKEILKNSAYKILLLPKDISEKDYFDIKSLLKAEKKSYKYHKDIIYIIGGQDGLQARKRRT